MLHCVTNALPYTQAGYTVRTHRIVTAQQAAGLDPHVVTSWGWPMLQGHADAPPYEEIDGIPYYRLLPDGRRGAVREPRPDDPGRRGGHRARHASSGPQVLHAATDHRNGSVALAVRDRTGTPFVYEVRGFLEETWASRDPGRIGSERHVLQREREAFLMRAADAVVTLAETMATEIVERGVPRERIFLAPNAVDDSLLTADYDGAAFRAAMRHRARTRSSSARCRASWATRASRPCCGPPRCCGTRARRCGCCSSATAPSGAALLEQVEELGLRDIAILPGRVGPEEALQAQAAIDIFVCPREDLRVTPARHAAETGRGDGAGQAGRAQRPARAVGAASAPTAPGCWCRRATRRRSPRRSPRSATTPRGAPRWVRRGGRRWRPSARGAALPRLTVPSTDPLPSHDLRIGCLL